MPARFAHLFAIDDVLALRLSDGTYRAAVCAQISSPNRNGPATSRTGARCTYDLAFTTFCGDGPPTIDDLRACSLAGHPVDTSFDASAILAEQPGADAFWHSPGARERIRPFFVGLDYVLIAHPHAAALVDRFTRVGKLSVRPGFKRQGGYRYAASFEELERILRVQAEPPRTPSGFRIDMLCEP